ncbi:hypothetical protein AURDEDRAFT_168068 [Auricularia subglabra TFB-10046 SS5]|nr:hypothetical protein AURDEDRAFT_168068 [Auricularia subglabra TFB-10046 SS5]
MLPFTISIAPDQEEKAVADAYGLFATNAVGVAGFTILVWDHVITFGDEVTVIWKRRKRNKNGPYIYLFLFLRYFAPMAYTVQLCSYFIRPDIWTPDICKHYLAFEGAVVVVILGVVGLMMMVRHVQVLLSFVDRHSSNPDSVYAMYDRSRKVVIGLGALYVVQFIIQGWLQTGSRPVHHTPGTAVAGCSMLFDKTFGTWQTAAAWMPMVYDTAVFVLTLHKTVCILRHYPSPGTRIARILLRDGALYYLAIVASNIPLIVMLVAAPEGIRNIAAQLASLITTTMMSRITLSLRRKDSVWQVGSLHTDDDISPRLHGSSA